MSTQINSINRQHNFQIVLQSEISYMKKKLLIDRRAINKAILKSVLSIKNSLLHHRKGIYNFYHRHAHSEIHNWRHVQCSLYYKVHCINKY